ncbi:MAG TPA: hypothetical protein VF266_25035 [Thermoanaerobaculia bacterium]
MRWIVFAVLLAGTIALALYLMDHGAPLRQAGCSIGCFELAFTPKKAAAIVDAWGAANVEIAREDIYADFAFLLFYASFLWLICRGAASHLTGRWLRAARIIAPAMLVAGALDAVENAGMLVMLSGTFAVAPVVAVCAAVKFALVAVGIVFIYAAHLAR